MGTDVTDAGRYSADDDGLIPFIRAELIERITRVLPADGAIEPMEGVALYRASRPTEPLHSVSAHAFCVIAQGSKVVLLGDAAYRYDPGHYLITTAELPVASHIEEASAEEPYLAVRIELDPALVSSVMVEAGRVPSPAQSSVMALNVSTLDADLLDAVLRLVRLADRPEQARFLAPMVTREIVYRLLTGEQGVRLRHLAVLNGARHRVAEAIQRVRREYDRPLRIDDMARDLGMSVSSFHHHFKSVTSMSPLQFQKQLRLQEARRLMLGEGYDATTAGFQVGYDEVSHFSREYKRLFGEPPMRDVARLREAAMEPSGLS